MRQSLPLGRIFGIQLRAHASWGVAFAFITFGLASGYFRFVAPRQGLALPLALGAVSALLLFASVLIHELSHSLVARARGMRVRDITLFIFGGVSNLEGEPRTARDEFLVAIVGPLTSLVLAGGFWLLGRSLGGPAGLPLLFGSGRSVAALSPTIAVVSYLATVNLLLGAFNLVPAFPLDGGRVFRSTVWGITHRLDRATTIAATIGQGFGFLMIGFGILRFVFGDLGGGLWTIVLGWFLSQAAAGARRERSLQASLEGVRVSDVMDPAPPLVDRRMSLHQVVSELVLRRAVRSMLVVDDGRPVGVIDVSTVAAVPRERWETTPVEQVMHPAPESVSPDAPVEQVLSLGGLVPVIANGRLVGVVDSLRVLRLAQLRHDLQPPIVRPSTA